MTNRQAQQAITALLHATTREAITHYINKYGDPIDWSDYTTRQILEEVWRSDCEAGEEENGILASMYAELA